MNNGLKVELDLSGTAEFKELANILKSVTENEEIPLSARVDYHNRLSNVLYNVKLKTELSKSEPDNFDVFEDRAISLLARWRKFHDREKEVGIPTIAEDSIQGFLNEINDSFTQNLLHEGGVEDVDKDSK